MLKARSVKGLFFCPVLQQLPVAVTRGRTGSNPNEAETSIAYQKIMILLSACDFPWLSSFPQRSQRSSSPSAMKPSREIQQSAGSHHFPFPLLFSLLADRRRERLLAGRARGKGFSVPQRRVLALGLQERARSRAVGAALRLQLQGMLCPRQNPRPGCLGAPSSCRAHSLVPGAGEAAHLRAPSQHRAGRPSAEPGCPPDQGEDGGAGRHEGQQPQEASCCREGGEEDKETLPTGHGAGAGGGRGQGAREKRPQRGEMGPGQGLEHFSPGRRGKRDLRLEEAGCDGKRDTKSCCRAG